MAKPDKRVIEFIKKHHVLTLATSNANSSWCCNCFYSYIEDRNMLVVTSDQDTKHVKDLSVNDFVSGSIVLETMVIGKIRGIQFTGIMYQPMDGLHKQAYLSYMKRFPFATLMTTTLWVIELNFIKMTDNRFGFGKKLLWKDD